MYLIIMVLIYIADFLQLIFSQKVLIFCKESRIYEQHATYIYVVIITLYSISCENLNIDERTIFLSESNTLLICSLSLLIAKSDRKSGSIFKVAHHF